MKSSEVWTLELLTGPQAGSLPVLLLIPCETSFLLTYFLLLASEIIHPPGSTSSPKPHVKKRSPRLSGSAFHPLLPTGWIITASPLCLVSSSVRSG